jgi:hypothetical protein
MGVQLIDCDRSRAPDILAILNEAIERSTALYDYRPRTPAMMDGWFEAKEKNRYPVIGAVDDQGRLLGFASYGGFRSWPAYKYTVEHSVYVEKGLSRTWSGQAPAGGDHRARQAAGLSHADRRDRRRQRREHFVAQAIRIRVLRAGSGTRASSSAAGWISTSTS